MIFGFFKRHEFACKCGCGFEAVDAELVQILNMLRAHFNAPVTINSACRCEKHNKDVGGKPKSKHVRGIAADVVVKGILPSIVYEFLDEMFPDSHGIGKYNTFTHFDVRSEKARW